MQCTPLSNCSPAVAGVAAASDCLWGETGTEKLQVRHII